MFSFGRPNKMRRDVANFGRAVTDQLVKAGVIEDDCLIEQMTLQWSADVVGCMGGITAWDNCRW